MAKNDVEMAALRLQEQYGAHEQASAPLLRQNTASEERPFMTEEVKTGHGSMHVVIQGNMKSPAIITYHDLGMNSAQNLQGYFNSPELAPVAKHFCVFHLNAPGQQEGAKKLDVSYVYPTMDELAGMITSIVQYYNLKRFIGFGVGVGANILCRYALQNAEKVDALCLINAVGDAAGWIEWMSMKVNLYYLRRSGMTESTQDYLIWHHFGRNIPDHSDEHVDYYREYLSKRINPFNLCMFLESYLKRTDLGISRYDQNKNQIQCSSLLITANNSPHCASTETLFSQIEPTKADLLKLSDCSGMVLQEEPEKVAEAFRLFLQGQGYVPSMAQKRPAYSRSTSLVDGAWIEGEPRGGRY